MGLSDCLPPLLKCSPEAVSDVGVVGVQVSREGTAQGHGQSHRPVRRVVDPGPGGEDRARHEDYPVEVGLSDHGAVHQVLHTGRPHALQHQLLVRIESGNKKEFTHFSKLVGDFLRYFCLEMNIEIIYFTLCPRKDVSLMFSLLRIRN